jgi:hypothetical protein
MAEAQLDLDISPALAALDDLSGAFDDIVSSFGTSIGDSLSSAAASAGDLGSALDDTTTTFASNLLDAMDAATNAAADIGSSLDDAAAGFGDALGGSGGGSSAEAAASGVSQAFDKIVSSSEGAASAMDLQELSSSALGATTSGLTGNMEGLIGSVLPQAAIFGGVTAAVGSLVEIGANAKQAIAEMQRVFGDNAASVFDEKVKGVGFSLGELDSKTGTSDTKMRGLLATFGQTAIGAGATSDEATNAARSMGVLDNILTTLKPSLGTADQNFQMIARGLGGSTRILQRYGITLDQAQVSHLALANAQEHGRDTASLFDKQMAGLQLTMEFLNKQAQSTGTTLNAQLNTGLDAPVVKLRALKGQLETTLEDIGVPLVDAGVKIATSLEPIILKIIETFGKLAKSVTDAVVPVASTLVDILTPALNAVADALGFLGPLIGPVVAGFVAFEAVKGVVNTVQAVSEGISSVIGVVQTASTTIVPAISSIIEALPAIGAALTNPVTLAVVGVVALTAGLYALGDAFGLFDDKVSQATIEGNKWATAQVQQIESTHDAVGAHDLLKTRLDTTDQGLKNLNKDTIDLGESFGKQNSLTVYGQALNGVNNQVVSAFENQKNWRQEAEAGFNSLDKLTAEHKVFTQALKDLEPQYEKEIQQHKTAAAQADVYATTLGITIPNQAILTTSALKSIDKEIPPLTQHYGEFGAAVIAGSGASGDAMKALMQDTDNFAKTIQGSVEASTNVFTHFKGKTDIATKDMESFFYGSQVAAGKWADGLNRLISENVDKGLVDQLAKLGPDSQPQLDAFQRMVDDLGVNTVNSIAHMSDAQVKAVEDGYSQMEGATLIHTARLQAIQTAYSEDLKNHTSSNLDALKGQFGAGFDSIVSMAEGALPKVDQQLDNVKKYVESIPTTWSTTITADESRIDAAVASARAALASLPNEVNIAIAANMGLPAAHATGGIFTAPHVGLVAEAGPEAILPLSDPSRAWQIIQQSGLMKSLDSASTAMTHLVGQAATTPEQEAATVQHIHNDNSVTIHGVDSAADAVGEFTWAMKTGGR